MCKFLLLLLLLPCVVHAQGPGTSGPGPVPQPIVFVDSAPTGSSCVANRIYSVRGTGKQYQNISGTCTLVSNGTSTLTGSGASGRLPLWSSASALSSDASGTYSGSTTTLEFQIPALRLIKAIGAVSTDALMLENTTPATVGAQKWSPRLRFSGRGWKTDATAGSQTVDWIVENQPVQGTANPSTNLVFSSQVNGGGYTPKLTVNSAGDVAVTDDAYGSGWNGSSAVPTKNAVYDKIETLGGGTSDALLSTTVVDTNTGTKQNLYTCPALKHCVITKIIARNASTSLAAMGDMLSFGFNAGADDYAGSGFSPPALANLTDGTLAIGTSLTIPGGNSSAVKIGNAADVFGCIFNDTSIVGTLTIDVFGYTY